MLHHFRPQKVSFEFSKVSCETTRKVSVRNGGSYDVETGERRSCSGEKTDEGRNFCTAGEVGSLRKPSQPNIQPEHGMKESFSAGSYCIYYFINKSTYWI